ncbi:protein quaking-A isoform X1 [Tachysurus ichikawai]
MCLTLWTCYDLGAMATKVRRHDSRVHPYQRIVTADRGEISKREIYFEIASSSLDGQTVGCCRVDLCVLEEGKGRSMVL